MGDIQRGSRQQICGQPAPSYPLQLPIKYVFIGPAAEQPKLGLVLPGRWLEGGSDECFQLLASDDRAAKNRNARQRAHSRIAYRSEACAKVLFALDGRFSTERTCRLHAIVLYFSPMACDFPCVVGYSDDWGADIRVSQTMRDTVELHDGPAQCSP
jgi:hypothetical protein